MGWKSKFTRRRKEKKRNQSATTDTDTNHNERNEASQPVHLKSCLKNKPPSDDGQSSFSSSSFSSSRSGGSGLMDRRLCSNQASQRTHSTKLSASTTSTSSSGRLRKNVRFHEIQIREYQRTVGDNPSVSTGPPVGIDWKFEETVKMDINGYESYRGPRREQLEMVLTRHERENLLLEWGVPTYLIADGTRSALKVKNQRKQTVVNAGKVARLEEVIETASKRLKDAFSLRSRSSDSYSQDDASSQYGGEKKDKEDHRDNSSISRVDENSTINMETRAKSQNDSMDTRQYPATRVVSVEPDADILERMGMNVCVSNVVSNAPEGALMTSCSSLDQYVENIDEFSNDDAYTLGATTFGNNSVSPSVMELERFYQELEREMFGEETSLPCMVGQTLEVGTCVHDIHEPEDDMTLASAAPSVVRHQTAENLIVPEHHYDADQYQRHRHVLPPRYDFESHEMRYHVSPEYEGHFPPRSLSNSREELPWMHGYAPQLQPNQSRARTGSYDGLLDYKDGSYRCNYNCYPRLPASHHVYRSNGQSYFDGPQICHSPLQHGHLSPHQWMGECDEPRSYLNTAVTIIEDCPEGPLVPTGQPSY